MKNKVEEKKIIFFGSSFISKKILNNLIEQKLNIKLVITQPDKPVGRKKIVQQNSVKKLALSRKIPLKQFSKLDKKAVSFISKIKPDIIITCSYGKIIPEEIINLPKFKSINIHPSLLPKFRGPSPIQTVLLNGKNYTGISFMLMDKKMDHGDIIFQKKIKINKNDDYNKLEKVIIDESNRNLVKVIKKWINDEIKPKKQVHSKATYTKIIEKKDGFIDFRRENAQEIYNKYRAFVNWPRIYSFWKKNDKKKKIIFEEIEFFSKNLKTKYQNGEVAKIDKKLAIKTKNGFIIIKKIQIQGKKIINAQDFVNGHQDFIESILN